MCVCVSPVLILNQRHRVTLNLPPRPAGGSPRYNHDECLFELGHLIPAVRAAQVYVTRYVEASKNHLAINLLKGRQPPNVSLGMNKEN